MSEKTYIWQDDDPYPYLRVYPWLEPERGPEPWRVKNDRLAKAPHFTSEKPLTKRQRRRRKKRPTT